jgi:hypothetical protein
VVSVLSRNSRRFVRLSEDSRERQEVKENVFDGLSPLRRSRLQTTGSLPGTPPSTLSPAPPFSAAFVTFRDGITIRLS